MLLAGFVVVFSAFAVHLKRRGRARGLKSSERESVEKRLSSFQANGRGERRGGGGGEIWMVFKNRYS